MAEMGFAKLLLYFLLILSLLTFVTCNDNDEPIQNQPFLGVTNSRKNLKDPTDPFPQEFSTGGEKFKNAGECSCSESDSAALSSCQNSREILQKRMEKMELEAKLNHERIGRDHFKNFITQFVEKLAASNENIDEFDFDIHFQMSGSDWNLLNKFAFKSPSQTLNSINSTYNAITHAMKGVRVRSSEDYSWKKKIENYFQADMETFTYMAVLLVCSIVLITLPALSHFSWRHLLWRTLIILFVISVPWNWFHMYKVAFAKKQMEVVKDLPEKCKKAEITAWMSIFEWIKSSFTIRDDPCLKYYEAISIDPMWEVPPTKAIAVTLTKFFLEPFQHLGESFSQFFNALFKDLPITVWPLALLTFLLLAVLVIVIVSGYRIRLPLFGAIEPAAGREPQNMVREDLEQIKNQCTQTLNRIEDVREQLLEDRVQAAIEPAVREPQNIVREDLEQIMNQCAQILNKIEDVPRRQQQLLEVEVQAAPILPNDIPAERPHVNEEEKEHNGIQQLVPALQASGAKSPVQETGSYGLNNLSGRGDASHRHGPAQSPQRGRGHSDNDRSENIETSLEDNNQTDQ